MGEWKEYKLGDIVVLNYGKALKENNRVQGNIPVYSSAGLTGWHNEPLVNSKGIIIGRKGTIGKVYLTDKPFYCIDTAYYVLPNDEVYDSKFLYYLLSTLGLEHLNEDSAVPGLNRNTAYDQDVLLPPLPEQKSIASILNSLDDKIDLLHRQNKTLEELAETLFRQWFVVEAEAGWEEKTISDVIEVRDGTHDSPKPKEAGYFLITSKHLKAEGIDFNNAYKISEDDYISINKRSKVNKNDILFSMIGTLGLIYYVQDEPDYAIKNIGLFKSSQKPEFAKFLYLLLKSPLGKRFIYESADGSTQEYISLGSLRDFEFKYPGNSILKEFDKTVIPFFEKIFSNDTQIRTLIRLRDTLLPKLMSGEVRVEN